jgi:AraC family L-rhamnose operon regulatory protein RhaS
MKRYPRIYCKSSGGDLIDTHRPLLNSIRRGKIDFHALSRGHYPGDRIKAGQLPGLLSQGFWDARGKQDWGMDSHYNEGVEICLLETGSMRFAVDGKIHPLRPGDLTITRPWQVHRQGDPSIAAGRLHWTIITVGAQRPDQPWRWPGWVVLSLKDQAELTRRLRLTESAVWRASPEVIRSFQRMAMAVAQNPGDDRTSCLAVGLNELLLGILDMLRAGNLTECRRLASPEHSVERFLADLRQNLNSLEQDWTLEGMASACGLGTTRFSRICRRITNDSPIHFLNLARLDAAARLLRQESARSVTDIALDCGFNTSQYFANQFRRHFGETPTAFRKRR